MYAPPILEGSLERAERALNAPQAILFSRAAHLGWHLLFLVLVRSNHGCASSKGAASASGIAQGSSRQLWMRIFNVFPARLAAQHLLDVVFVRGLLFARVPRCDESSGTLALERALLRLPASPLDVSSRQLRKRILTVFPERLLVQHLLDVVFVHGVTAYPSLARVGLGQAVTP